MSEILSIEWNERQLAVVQGRGSGSSASISKAALIPWPSELDPKNVTVVGEWLKGQLSSRGFSAKEVSVSLPRGSVVVRHLELPAVPDDELPDMVRLQAATKVTLAAGQYLLDYVPLPPRQADMSDVLMSTVPTEVSERISKIVQAADLELRSLGVSSMMSCELVSRLQNSRAASSQLQLVLTKADHQLTVSMLRGPNVLTSQQSEIDVVDKEDVQFAINGEVNRVRLAAEKLHNGLPVSQVWVAAEDGTDEALCSFLKDRMQCEGRTFDPLKGAKSSDADPAMRGAFAGVVGQLFAASGAQTEIINFLEPRKAVEKQDHTKLRIGLAIGAVAALLLAGWFLLSSRLAAQDKKIAAFKTDESKLKREVSDGEQDSTDHGIVAVWDSQRSDWLTEITELNKSIPGRENMLIQEYSFRTAKKPPKSKDGSTEKATKSIITMTAAAKTRDDTDSLGDALEENGYSVLTTTDKDRSRVSDYDEAFVMKIGNPIGRVEEEDDE